MCRLGGILLTGGSSTRMGADKARLTVGGTPLSRRLGRLLVPLVDLAVEVGEGASELRAVREAPSGAGPLAAIGAGYTELLNMGLSPDVACLVLACDLPHLNSSVLGRIARWPGDQSVLPVIGNFAQPLCARWSSHDLHQVVHALQRGESSLQSLPDREGAILLDERTWGGESIAFEDVDRPEDLVRLNLHSHEHISIPDLPPR